MNQKILINRLKLLLKQRDITQKQFAALINMTPNSISRICNNEQQPSLVSLREMALALDVDISELLYRTKE